ncbi:MAG TPA: hypothetical protein PKM48_10855, partial [Parvularculaceae bacterium]|nr:hypothetical protein [Parvularculaceae bacterium]
MVNKLRGRRRPRRSDSGKRGADKGEGATAVGAGAKLDIEGAPRRRALRKGFRMIDRFGLIIGAMKAGTTTLFDH